MPGSWFDTREWFDGNRDGFGDPVWGLEECCGVEESLFLTFYVVYAAVFFILNRWTIFKPMRLLTVFLHEFGHATACWISGGSVRKIEVYENEGGVTGYTGGCRLLVIPAGYVGAAFWGGTFVALSGGKRLGSTICAGMIICFLLVSLFINPNRIVIYITMFFTIVLGLAIYIEWYVFEPMLGFLTLFFGVFIGFYSVKDIYDGRLKEVTPSHAIGFCHVAVLGASAYNSGFVRSVFKLSACTWDWFGC